MESKGQQDDNMVHKQQRLERREKEKNGEATKRSDEIKVMYTNIDRTIAKLINILSKREETRTCMPSRNKTI